MKTNLSSQIKLEYIPSKYYDPQGELEVTSLTREEKIYTRIFENLTVGSRYLAKHIVERITKSIAEHGKCVIAIGAGQSTLPVYAALIEMYEKGEVDFENVVFFNLNEFFPLTKDGPSTWKRLQQVLFSHINVRPENLHTFNPSTNKADIYDMCREYAREIEQEGGLDLTVCEVGPMGSLGFNEPGSLVSSPCRLVLFSQEVRQSLAKDYGVEDFPKTAITLGVADIMRSSRVMCMAWGENRSKVVAQAIEGPVTDAVPSSFLQMHNHARIVLDLSSADQLTRISMPWKVTSCEWTDKLIRRAIVWLSQEINKPILKLTDKDYKDNGLGELVALYGSAYNVNIKVFNELQHTITGWPGGKPNADDTYRPERANPYPKRVIVFSPHPDDDVISMGGTLKRLVDQHHDVYVAYETSGNIAVGDEDMMRYFMMFDKIAPEFGFATEEYKKLSNSLVDFIAHKKPGETDLPEIREIKTMIRQAEATIACNFIGVKPDHIRFLRLPFYETGTIKKGELSERDIEIVKKLIEEVKPHQIFVAGDLADPHGTHRVCTDAVLAAIDELKDEDWMKDCRIWMYRGAWAEWEIDHIEMAVPISPEELRFKRNSILKHQSQMENAPFLGDDDRLFWQRAEERNRATARLYQDLGLASYEAMEAFVEYKPIR
ncbi:MAG: glucosamine-6-phosphate deaminase [Bacteroidales bacterium]|nr:glucosamine-6-phosphate deaminase [Bacteroidales bacterium]MDE6085906.1 PIG-L family deacetylase [Muribaculaceae bacterium]